MTVEIPGDLPMWHLHMYPEGAHDLRYHCAMPTRLHGHLVDVIGLGETAQQAVDECIRARHDLHRRTS